MTEPAGTSEALQLALELEKLLEQLGERNHLRGVTAVRQSLESGEVASAKSLYRSLCGGNGTFSDYNIWHENVDTRRTLNAPLDRLRSRLSTVLGDQD
jgi:hypothetical protein